MSTSILIVDDEEIIQRSLTRIFESRGFWCATAGDAVEARAALDEHAFDLALCDVNMPGESGIDLVQFLLGTYPELAVIMVTGVDDPEIASAAIEAGAYGYVIKPFTSNEILINVINALHRRRLELDSAVQREQLARTLRERTVEVWNSVRQVETSDNKIRAGVEEMVYRLSLAAELRDREIALHLERVSGYAVILATELGFDPGRCENLRLATRLHDVGKIGVPDRVLHKPGKYSALEMEVMRKHAALGYDLLRGSDAELLDLAATIAWTHHERWDGSGYPRGLAGEDIPLEGRIVAIADVFDALMSKRPYKPAYPIGRVVEIMTEETGHHFDPALCELFLQNLDRIMNITQEFAS